MNNEIVNDKLFLNLFELFKNKIHKTNENLVVFIDSSSSNAIKKW